jgi:enamine deaminase RidA (YjgF/YER057c/UK114 family)
MTEYRTVDAQRPWAAVVGYSRAVRLGNLIEVSGTSATTLDGQVVAPGDPYLQTKHILEVIVGALAELGASVTDVVRTRVYLTDIDHWEAVGRAHGEVFADVRPACSFIEIGRLMLPDLVVEVEVTALVDA